MKVITKILAIYILSLSLLPCNDIHAIAIEQTGINIELISLEHSNDHDHCLDFCSPFCSCDCCQTMAETLINNTVEIEISPSNIEIIPIYKIKMDYTYSFWNPPKG